MKCFPETNLGLHTMTFILSRPKETQLKVPVPFTLTARGPYFSSSSILSVNRLLNLREDLDHLLIQIWVVGDHHFRIPCHRDKDSVDATAEWRGENVADL